MTLLPIEKFILSYRRKNSPKVRGCTHGYHLFLSSSVDDSASVCSGCSFRSSFSLFNFSRSEERRVGKECECRWWPNHYKKEKRAERVWISLYFGLIPIQ